MFEGNREHDYRERSVVLARQMNSVGMSKKFICKQCKQPKEKAGRVNMVAGANQFGYRCAECVAKRGKA